MFETYSLDFDIPPSIPQMSAPTQKVNPKPPAANIVKPVTKNQVITNKNMGFSNIPDFPSVPTDVPTGEVKEKDDDDDDEDFDELLNRFEDLKTNKK